MRRSSDVMSSNFSSELNALQIELQSKVPKNSGVPVGTYTKVIVDQNGLVTRGLKLEESDIPNISIQRVIGLEGILGSITRDTPVVKQRRTIESGTGTKINYDKFGHVISSSRLLENDIPELSMSKISGLNKKIDDLMNMMNAGNDDTDIHTVNPGTHTKVSYDSSGRIIKGSSLEMEDLPVRLLSQLNLMESNQLNYVTIESMNRMQRLIDSKVSRPNVVYDDNYHTKVRFNSDGMMISSQPLSLSDLPKLSISDISDLRNELNSKVTSREISELRNDMNDLVGSTVTSRMRSFTSQLESKADKSELNSISRDIKNINGTVSRILTSLPPDSLVSNFEEFRQLLFNLVGRINVIESKLGIQSSTNIPS